MITITIIITTTIILIMIIITAIINLLNFYVLPDKVFLNYA